MADASESPTWRAWVPEALAVVTDWDADTQDRALTIAEAKDLAERIARALQAAVQRGHPQPER